MGDVRDDGRPRLDVVTLFIANPNGGIFLTGTPWDR
jgi:hypothetical protein